MGRQPGAQALPSKTTKFSARHSEAYPQSRKEFHKSKKLSDSQIKSQHAAASQLEDGAPGEKFDIDDTQDACSASDPQNAEYSGRFATLARKGDTACAAHADAHDGQTLLNAGGKRNKQSSELSSLTSGQERGVVEPREKLATGDHWNVPDDVRTKFQDFQL